MKTDGGENTIQTRTSVEGTQVSTPSPLPSLKLTCDLCEKVVVDDGLGSEMGVCPSCYAYLTREEGDSS